MTLFAIYTLFGILSFHTLKLPARMAFIPGLTFGVFCHQSDKHQNSFIICMSTNGKFPYSFLGRHAIVSVAKSHTRQTRTKTTRYWLIAYECPQNSPKNGDRQSVFCDCLYPLFIAKTGTRNRRLSPVLL